MALPGRRITLADLARENERAGPEDPIRLLHSYLLELTGKTQWSGKSVGQRLKAIRGTVLNGLWFETYDVREGLAYQLRSVEEGTQKQSPAGSAPSASLF